MKQIWQIVYGYCPFYCTFSPQQFKWATLDVRLNSSTPIWTIFPHSSERGWKQDGNCPWTYCLLMSWVIMSCFYYVMSEAHSSVSCSTLCKGRGGDTETVQQLMQKPADMGCLSYEESRCAFKLTPQSFPLLPGRGKKLDRAMFRYLLTCRMCRLGDAN